MAAPDDVAPAPAQAGAKGAPAWIAGRRRLALAGILLLGLVVYWPSLRSEFMSDDYLHASMIEGSCPIHRGPFNLYDFIDEAERPVLLGSGMLPWWSHPELRIRFLRPLPSALRWTEQRLFGRSPVPPHVHSLLWWVAVVVAAHRLFWHLFSPRPALMATLFFAISPCHALPLAWVANRETLISLTFGILALTSYVRWREQGGAGRAAAAAALFAVSMAGGEYALCLGGYVLTFELFGQSGACAGQTRAFGKDLARRALGLLLYAAPAAAYLGLRATLGYGSKGSSLYVDPLSAPLDFLRAAPRRLAALVTQEWLTVDDSQLYSSMTLAALVICGAALIVGPLRRTFAALDVPTRSHAKGMFWGSQLALIPVLAVDPSPRVLGGAVLGLAPALALLLDHAWFPAEPPGRQVGAELTGLVALAVAFAQFVHAPVTAFFVAERFRRDSIAFAANVMALSRRITDPKHTELVILRGGERSLFLPFALARYGRMPARWRVLSMTGHVLGMRRNARTLELVAPHDQGMFFMAFSEDLFRDTNRDIQAGQVFETPGLRATVLEVGSWGPFRVAFEADRDLGAPNFMWVSESWNGVFSPAAVPGVGYGDVYDPWLAPAPPGAKSAREALAEPQRRLLDDHVEPVRDGER